MQKYLLIIVAGVLVLAASGCWLLLRKGSAAPVVDEKYAKEVVEKALSLSCPLAAKRLTGGLTGAQLFRVTGGAREYVVRVAPMGTSQQQIEQSFANMKVASDGGYGPQVYFTDPARGLVIMEYLPDSASTLALPELQSERFIGLLVDLLHKIHRGPAFGAVKDVFELLYDEQQCPVQMVDFLRAKREKDAGASGIPFARLEQVIQTIKKTSLVRVESVPCHNDLNPGNLRLVGDCFKVIDFDMSGQSNPYFDIATIAIFAWFDQTSENLLLTKYLEHQPTVQEQACLYLMKQVALLFSGLAVLTSVPDHGAHYGTLRVPAFREFLAQMFAGKIDLGQPEDRLRFAKAMLEQVLANAKTQEFRDAVKLLS